MKNSRWVCAKCGRGFSRKWSGERHIRDVEGGASTLIGSDEYELGVRSGTYLPDFPRPVYHNIVDIFKQKLREKFVDYLAESTIKDPDSRKFVGTIFMNEVFSPETKFDTRDEFSKLLSKLRSQPWSQ